MNTRKLLMMCLTSVLLMLGMGGLTSAAASDKPVLIYVPIDNRPITDLYTVQTMERAGYTVMVPPDELLGGNVNEGNVDGLWAWLNQAADTRNTVAAVVSSDSLIYGSLVTSRRHGLAAAVLDERLARLRSFHEHHPDIRLYAFSSIMRTPVQGSPGGKEPEYYVQWGASIFEYSALTDKQEMKGLTAPEQARLAYLKQSIPQDVLTDWLGRRNKNLAVNKALIDMSRQGVFRYFALGRDDNAPLSQTHMEGRKLKEYGQDLDFTKFQNMSGIDEIGLLLLTKASNDFRFNLPFVYVEYNTGLGGHTVPAYSDEKISATITDYVKCIGGMEVTTPKRADLVLMMNTAPNGERLYGGDPANKMTATPRSEAFAQRIEGWLNQGKNTGIADIAYSNGADNSLCRVLRDHKLLYRLGSYAGWNTATNSLGYALPQGTMAVDMPKENKDYLLTIRYLDEWAYQSNIRQELGQYAAAFGADALKTNLADIEKKGTELQQKFARENLAEYPRAARFTMVLPWQRFFEDKVITE